MLVQLEADRVFVFAGTLYAEFGNEVRDLKTALENVNGVINKANRNRDPLGDNARSPNILRAQDEESLLRICGDFKRTLERCKRLLQREKYFQWRDGFVYNVLWEVAAVKSEVEKLKVQLHGHVIKMDSVLGPLQLRLLSNANKFMMKSHADLAGRMDRHHTETMKRFDKIEGTRLGKPSTSAQMELAQQVRETMDIPPQVEDRFSPKVCGYSDECVESAEELAVDTLTCAFVTCSEGYKQVHPRTLPKPADAERDAIPELNEVHLDPNKDRV